jgi:hypothetical protein
MKPFRGRARLVVGALAASAGLATFGLTQAGSSPAHANTSVVLQVSGSGNTTTAAFATGSDWSLHYTFACPTTGRFRAVEYGDHDSGLVVDDLTGPAGNHTMYYHDVAGAHRIAVTTSCQWTLTATDGDQLPKAY